MLDTFAKRLNSQGVTSPGDISTGDRWAIGGSFKPSPEAAGFIAATLGALAAGFAGTVTNPAATWTQGDRWRVELHGLPGAITAADRWAFGGSFLFVGSGASPNSAMKATLGALSASLRGTNSSPIVGGKLAAALGPIAASLRGEAYYDVFFDVDYSITPAFTPTVLPASLGALNPTLGALSASFRGQALGVNGSNGQILASLGALTSSIVGTMTAPAGRSGKVKADFGALSMSARGSSVPPQGVIGSLQPVLGALGASLRGTIVVPAVQGQIAATLGPISGRLYGQALLPGTIYGLIAAELGPLSSSLRGGFTPSGNVRPGRVSRATSRSHVSRSRKNSTLTD